MRHAHWLAVAVLLLGASSPRSTPERSRLDPELQRVSLDVSRAGENIEVIFRLEPEVPLPQLDGVAFRTRIADVVTAQTTIGRLSTLATSPLFLAIEHARTFHTRNDLASASTIGSRGAISVAGGTDTYAFNGTAGATARIWAGAEASLQTRFTCTDVAGTVTGGGPGTDAQTTVTWASTGAKTIVVSGQASTTGSYVLFIVSSVPVATTDLTSPYAVFYAGSRAREARALYGADGSGVAIGVVDTGVDFTHVDLRKTSGGATRLLTLWDQTLTAVSGESSSSVGYGVEYSEAQINTTLSGATPGFVREQDTDGHGTHVAATAAGTSSSFPGAAPGARLIVVKTDFNETHIIDAVNWFFGRAGQLGYSTAVLNLSLGTHDGPHDGTGALDAACDGAQDRGHYIVAAAGNEGQPDSSGRTIHAQTIMAASGTATWTFHPSSANVVGSGKPHIIDIWADGADAYQVAFTDTGNPLNTVTAASGATATVGPTATFVGQATINNKTDSPSNGATHIQIQLYQTPADDWTLGFARTANGGSGLVNGWVGSQDGFFNSGAIALNADGSVPGTISEPGTSKRAITAGVYRGKFAFNNAASGVTRESDGIGSGVPGALALFSSRGPTRDGRAKPDIFAPGAYLGSARSSNAAFASTQVDVDGIHAYLEGSSMSTAEVSGVLALLAQRNSILLPEDLKTSLTSTALSDALASNKINAVGLVGSVPVRSDVNSNGKGCSASIATRSFDPRWAVLGVGLLALAWPRSRRLLWLVLFLLAALSASAQDEVLALPTHMRISAPEDDMTVSGFLRGYAGGWSNDGFGFDAFRADGERSINVSVLPIVGLEGGVQLIHKWGIFATGEYGHSGALTIWTLGLGVSYTMEIGDFVGKLPPSEITFYGGGLWGHADVSDSNFGSFDNGWGYRLGVMLTWRIADHFAAGLFGEFRALQFNYRPTVIGGDTQLGGAGGVLGLSAEWRF